MRARTAITLLTTGLTVAGCGGGGSSTPPTISGVTQNSGYTIGGQEVVISGSGFLADEPGGITVMFGAEAGVGCAIVDDATVVCTTPPQAAGTVDVSVTNDNGDDVLAGGFTYSDDFLLAADGKSGYPGQLYVVDPTTAAATVIGPVGYGVTGLCMAADGTLYATESTQGGNYFQSYLLEIDPTTGLGTQVGQLLEGGSTEHNSMPDCSFNGAEMIAWTESGDDLTTVDTATGAVTVVGNSGVSTAGSGLAVHPDGTVYSASNGTSGVLRTIDPVTGVASAGPTMSGGTYSEINSLAFHDGVLYGVDAEDSGGVTPASLVTIDVATGAITVVGDLPHGIDSLVSARPVTLAP